MFQCRFRYERGRAHSPPYIPSCTCKHLNFACLRVNPSSSAKLLFERCCLPKHVVHLGHFRHVPLRDVTVKRYRTIENAEGKNKTSVGVMAGLKPRWKCLSSCRGSRRRCFGITPCIARRSALEPPWKWTARVMRLFERTLAKKNQELHTWI